MVEPDEMKRSALIAGVDILHDHLLQPRQSVDRQFASPKSICPILEHHARQVVEVVLVVGREAAFVVCIGQLEVIRSVVCAQHVVLVGKGRVVAAAPSANHAQ